MTVHVFPILPVAIDGVAAEPAVRLRVAGLHFAAIWTVAT